MEKSGKDVSEEARTGERIVSLIVRKTVSKIKVPMRPNFIDVNGQMVSIVELPDDLLKAIGKEWTRELLALAKKRREKKPDGQEK